MQDKAKRYAAIRALKHVRPNIVLGLGSGSTARTFVEVFAEQFPERKTISCVCTSSQTEALARDLGLNLLPENSFTRAHITVDGADEVTRKLNMIKGGGGALLRERIVAAGTKYHITIVDDTKMHAYLGTFPLPIEIAPYGTQFTTKWILEKIKSLGLRVQHASLRKLPSGDNYVTDNSNFLFDVKISRITAPARLSRSLYTIPGVMDHGIFVDLTDLIIVADDNGHIDEYR